MSRLTIRIDFEDESSVGPGKVALLEAIRATGSLRQAAERLQMSYRRAWLLLGATEEQFAQPLTEPIRGGRHGGGSRLTEFGEAIIAHYRRIEALSAQATDAEVKALAAKLRRIPKKNCTAGNSQDPVIRHKSLKK